MTLTGILKSTLLVIAGVLIWGTHVTSLQFFGYIVALGGLIFYSVHWEQVQEFGAWLKAMWESPTVDETNLSPMVRRVVIAGFALVLVGMIVTGLMRDGRPDLGVVAARGP